MKAEIILTDNNINIDLNEPTIDVSTEDGFSVTIIGGVGPQGNRGPEGPKGEKGDNYVLTEKDKEDIAELAAEKVDAPVKDVQVAGESILDEQGVANLRVAGQNDLGVVKAIPTNGITISAEGSMRLTNITDLALKLGNNANYAVNSLKQHQSVFYGLAKAAGDTTQSASNNPVGQYTDEAKEAIQTMLDVPARGDIKDAPVQDVQLNGASILDENGAANVPVASNSTFGVIKILVSNGINIDSQGRLNTVIAAEAEIKTGSGNNKIIAPSRQHQSVFYGLAKAAGDTTQSASSNRVGQYTDEAKAAIQAMLDVPANADIPEIPVEDVQINGSSIVDDGVAAIPCANDDTLGVVQTVPEYGVTVMAGTKGKLRIQQASAAQIKAGLQAYKPIVPANQQMAVFFGLAAAAGDTTQAQSANAVGTYTNEAKAAIQTMIGIPTMAEIIAAVHDSYPAAEEATF